MGFVVGFISLSGPICCALYYVPRLEVLPWVHALPIVVNLAIIVFGSLFLRNNNKNDILSSEGRHKGPFGVKIQMCCTIIK